MKYIGPRNDNDVLMKLYADQRDITNLMYSGMKKLNELKNPAEIAALRLRMDELAERLFAVQGELYILTEK